MSFDQHSKSLLLSFVNDSRHVLEEEFTRQLQNDYGLDPASGVITDLDSLQHLNDAQRETARILRETLAHYTSGHSSAKNMPLTLERIVREQSFTVLNRLVALRMAEARGLLIESVGGGYQSRGFQLYSRLAAAGLGETGDSYRIYLFSVFDELAQDLPALFDRFSPTGRLFPREAALLQLLALLNNSEIVALWGEDETIGWIYQYFNSKDERKKMRQARAPRNSRELAVRNQFFTPRYVVQFLVDNTLGLLWFKACSGQTSLKDKCRQLVLPLEQPISSTITLIDPRSIKLLDPACGSMHFGLYAFDLFVEMYREAWLWEQKFGGGSLVSSNVKLPPLSKIYDDEAALMKDVPRLIIEQNIYGVEIDARAAQIASFALWLRAQREWHDSGVKAKDRPAIGRGHVIAALSPPGEQDLRQQFKERLDERDGELLESTLRLLTRLPELGLLLRVERELPNLIRTIYGEYGALFKEQDVDQWLQAENRLRSTLTDFIQTAQSTFQGRLFAEDALEGLRLIDLTREKFDVIVMNPPFGESAAGAKSYIDENYTSSKGNLLANFVERSSELLVEHGYLGAITSRTCFFLKTFADFRKNILTKKFTLKTFADFGSGVLDATIETAATTWVHSSEKSQATFFRHLKSQNKSEDLLQSVVLRNLKQLDLATFEVSPEQFHLFEDCPFVYWIDKTIAEKLSSFPTVEPDACEIRVGLQTCDDFRFLRLWYEVLPSDINSLQNRNSNGDMRQFAIDQSAQKQWSWYAKTDKSSAFQASIHALVNWKDNGAEIRALIEGNGDSASRYIRSEERYFDPAFSYMLRATRLVPYVVPVGVIPTAGRSQIYPKRGLEDRVLVLMGSNLATCVARFRGEYFNFPKFQNSMVCAVPYVSLDTETMSLAMSSVADERARISQRFSTDESEILFLSPLSMNPSNRAETDSKRKTLLGDSVEARIASAYGLSEQQLSTINRDLIEALESVSNSTSDEDSDSEDSEDNVEEDSAKPKSKYFSLLSYLVGCSFGRWDIRLASKGEQRKEMTNPFESLPSEPPGMLTSGAKTNLSELKYPIQIASNGILVDDSSSQLDICEFVQRALLALPPEPVIEFEKLACDELGVRSIREYLTRPNKFFAEHLQEYSKSRRRAPIYWPISTRSSSYTIWLYYPALNSQTLFTAINDLLDGPRGKIAQVAEELSSLESKAKARTREDEERFEKLREFHSELINLRDGLLAVAKEYRPNHNDGVLITAAPLWQFFQYKPWQKILKDTWLKLQKEEYDWSHLAMSYWPGRIKEKCKSDKSLAIAHGSLDLYLPPKIQTKQPRRKK